jgi:hypothetical protein
MAVVERAAAGQQHMGVGKGEPRRRSEEDGASCSVQWDGGGLPFRAAMINDGGEREKRETQRQPSLRFFLTGIP